ncbi:hypothetical protein ACIPV2_01265 [Microbacterium sp. NPDC089987]|uniref:hypothetical protein n=1 Tax=Microbacterium sp. NPDC089987 TaxID=3364202 RepID=UPI00381496A9
MEVENALAFWYFYGRHPHRALSGMLQFMIKASDFRYVDRGSYWRFTREQTEDMLRTLWAGEADDVLRRMQN